MPFLISDVSTATDRAKPNAEGFCGTKASTAVISNNDNKVKDWNMMTNDGKYYFVVMILQLRRHPLVKTFSARRNFIHPRSV